MTVDNYKMGATITATVAGQINSYLPTDFKTILGVIENKKLHIFI